MSVVSPNETDAQLREIDAVIDDGDLTTGAFRTTAGARYTSVLE